MAQKFRTILDSDSSKFISNSGSPFLQEYHYDVDKNGVKRLVKKDSKINVYEKIQADYDSTDINKIMLRFSLGETEVIDVKKGFFADVTGMPATYAELFDRVEDCKEYFDSLPPDLKAMFDNSYSEFFTEYDSKGFIDKINAYNERFSDHSFDIDDVKSNDIEVLSE